MFNLFGGSSAKRLTAADAVAMAAKGEVTLLDVREAGEVAASGTAKGGVLCAIAREKPIPVYFIGVGEKLEDLETFNAREFAQALLA